MQLQPLDTYRQHLIAALDGTEYEHLDEANGLVDFLAANYPLLLHFARIIFELSDAAANGKLVAQLDPAPDAIDEFQLLYYLQEIMHPTPHKSAEEIIALLKDLTQHERSKLDPSVKSPFAVD